jgi:hypothetical protein
MTYKTTKDNRLVNEITLGEGYPLSSNLQPLKVGGEASILQIASPIPQSSNKGKLKVEGDLEVTGSILKQPTLHILNGGAYNSGTSKFYLPLVGYNIEYTSNTSRNENVAYVTPYDGKVKKLVLRSEARCDTVVAGFHISTEGTEVPNSTATEEITVEMPIDDTTTTFNFTGATAFNAGDIMAISVTPDLAVNDLNWTLVLEYYID